MSFKQIAFNSFLVVTAIMFCVFSGRLSLKDQLFTKQKLTTIDGILNHLANIGLYFALLLSVVTTTIMSIRLIKHSVNPAIQPAVEQAQKLNAIIKNSIQHFLIFMGIYIYILTNKSFGIKWRTITLLPFWFLTARIQIVIAQFIKIIFGQPIDISIFGKTLTVICIALMICQVGGIQLIKVI